MKTKIQILFLLLAMMGLVQCAQAQLQSGDWEYSDNGDGTCTITKYIGSGGAVTIPGTIGGLTVVAIGDYAYATGAFYGSSVTSVVIPNSVTSIDWYAFLDCYSLTGIMIPDSVTFLGEGAFYGCSSLTSVSIGNGVTVINDGVFSHCSSLTGVTIPNSVTTIGVDAFYDCTSLTGVTIPDSVTSIAFEAFGECSSLTCVTIPNSVTTIGDYAFYGCNSLASVTIGSGVTSIGTQAFYYGSVLTSVLFEGNAPPDDGTAFANDSFATVYYQSGTTGWGPTFGGVPTEVFAFDYADNGDGTCTITKYTGSGGAVTIPGSIGCLTVTSIGAEAFKDCSSLTSVTIPDSVTSIGDYAFYGCNSLTCVRIPSSVTSIGTQTFYNCTILTSAYFEGNAPSDDTTAFANDSFATVYYLSGTVGWIPLFGGVPTEVLAFDYTENGRGTCTITKYTGSGGAVTIPGSIGCLTVTSIGTNAFANCYNLTNVSIGDGVTNIESYAFNDCTALASVSFVGNAPTADSTIFSSDTNVTVYYMPGTVGWGPTFGGVPTVELNPPPQISRSSIRISASGFGFTITGISNEIVVVEAGTNLVNWLSIETNILTGTSFNFYDPLWTNYPKRYYRVMTQ